MLNLTLLENRETPITIELVPVFGIEQRSEWGVISLAAAELSERIEAKLDKLDSFLALTPFGNENTTVDYDTLKIYVGFNTNPNQYGFAAVGGYNASELLSRSWGGWVGLNLDKIAADKVDLRSTAKHEILHTLGLGHSDNPADLMSEYASRGVRDLTYSDANELEKVGYDVTPISHIPDYSRVFGVGTTPNGWVTIENDEVDELFPGYVRVPDGNSWGYAPSFQILEPIGKEYGYSEMV